MDACPAKKQIYMQRHMCAIRICIKMLAYLYTNCNTTYSKLIPEKKENHVVNESSYDGVRGGGKVSYKHSIRPLMKTNECYRIKYKSILKVGSLIYFDS